MILVKKFINNFNINIMKKTLNKLNGGFPPLKKINETRSNSRERGYVNELKSNLNIRDILVENKEKVINEQNQFKLNIVTDI